MAPVPATIDPTVIANYADTRRSLAETFNFVIAAGQMIGRLRLIARVSGPTHSTQSERLLAVTLRQTLQLAGVLIAYDGPASLAPNAPNLTLAAPPLTDL